MLYDGQFRWEGSVECSAAPTTPMSCSSGRVVRTDATGGALTTMRRSVRDAIVGFTPIGGIIGFASTVLWLRGFVWGPATGL